MSLEKCHQNISFNILTVTDFHKWTPYLLTLNQPKSWTSSGRFFDSSFNFSDFGTELDHSVLDHWISSCFCQKKTVTPLLLYRIKNRLYLMKDEDEETTLERHSKWSTTICKCQIPCTDVTSSLVIHTWRFLFIYFVCTSICHLLWNIMLLYFSIPQCIRAKS